MCKSERESKDHIYVKFILYAKHYVRWFSIKLDHYRKTEVMKSNLDSAMQSAQWAQVVTKTHSNLRLLHTLVHKPNE